MNRIVIHSKSESITLSTKKIKEMKSLLEHRSIRKYRKETIAPELLEKLILAGVRASNTGNMQLYSVVVTKDEDKKSKLAPLHFNQSMVKGAPVVLTICADINRFNKWCEKSNAEAGYDNLLWFINSTIDASLFAQNICIAAEGNGLGICYLGTALYNAKEFIEVLNLPKGVIPITAITLGYPDEDPELTNRLPIEAIIHNERYTNYDRESIKSVFKEKENLASSNQFVRENGKENLAQVFTDVRYKKADNEYFSQKFLETLREQGFKI
ncbi:MAG TPA: nitroreductase family protein [Sunxiuqinia sp.]|nr:nitroreductase family protein [Sunxiuqinia sp.]